MCGIFCSIKQCSNNNSGIDALNICKVYLNERGPDKQTALVLESIQFYSSILWQQGNEPCVQPIDANGVIFLFNGDIFMDFNETSNSDTKWIFNEICKCTNEMQLIKLFRTVKGPYAIIFYYRKSNKLYFLRDSLGRNSLILTKIQSELIVSSIFPFKTRDLACKPLSIEIPPLGLYCMNLSDGTFKLFPWIHITSDDFYVNQINQIENIVNNKIIIDDTIEPDWLKIDPQITYNFKSVLNELGDGQPYSVLFEKLLSFKPITDTAEKLISLLGSSVAERVKKTLSACKLCLMQQNASCSHARIGILFSGGLDCTILAVLADKFVEKNIPIDLLNVAFEKIRKDKSIDSNFDVPDRLSAISSAEELKRLCPIRQWNLTEINVSRLELRYNLLNRISDLIWPLNTVLDESLGAALWFAARGEGLCNGTIYKSHARILLIGSGADELFGGYTRHRNAYLRENNPNSNTSLEKELELDWLRLPSRNLARDDRVIGDHGITPRAPYIQEDVVRFVRSLAPLQRSYHKLAPGLGDKLLLRLCGFKLGLQDTSILKKRALQFGSRVADSSQNATDTSKFFD